VLVLVCAYYSAWRIFAIADLNRGRSCEGRQRNDDNSDMLCFQNEGLGVAHADLEPVEDSIDAVIASSHDRAPADTNSEQLDADAVDVAADFGLYTAISNADE